ncbi:divergent polysaccharide deacetylase family protein [Rhodospira trueperi]|uniref:Uncharacterized conserved protein YibQ, putative polysaccharide deacetylase 2 family n=1 Tax=Rhodospira trueperi TaxID=69960 RepID=A0A1G7FZM9_9PROT|nr:divergent polysaccharide deacetylase family protein [Rhodospira trueperi]SDE81312.1 Uncharacterized conserved protein YibQ, putative polysaccharide deacetylase 2 family [Rhodospira trueperi]
MKLPGMARGHGRKRSNDPLGDPFEGIDLDSDPADDAAPSRGGRSAIVGAPDVDDDFGLPPAEPPDSASGLVARLFGNRPDGGGHDFRGFEDLDGSPLRDRQGGWQRPAMIVAGLAIVGGIGAWAYSSGGLDGLLGSDDTVTADAPDQGGDTDKTVQVVAPDRVVMALPPLTTPSSSENQPPVVADPTAATDRSPNRRPWLDGASDDSSPTEAASTDATPDGHGMADTADSHETETPPPTDHGTQTAENAHQQTDDPAGTAHDGGPDTHAESPTQMADAGHDTPGQTASPSGDHDHQTDGVRARVDLAAPDIDLPDVPGLMPVPDGVAPMAEPDAPNRLRESPPVPSYDQLAQADGTRGYPLASAPKRDLVETGPYGPVPRVGPDGTPPWQAYAARDQAPPELPRVAIVVHGLGMMTDSLQAAVMRLPPAVTLSFAPYADALPEKMQVARQAGHEVLLDLPTEGAAFPAQDPGPLGMLSVLPTDETRDRLDQLLAKGIGYVGLLATAPGRFTNAPEPMEAVLSRIREAGLVYLHQGEARALAANHRVLPPLRAVDVVIDQRGFAESIDARLAYLERVALARGSSIGIMTASPLAFVRLRAWATDLRARGVALAPLSAVIERGGGEHDASGGGGAARNETPAGSATHAADAADHG